MRSNFKFHSLLPASWPFRLMMIFKMFYVLNICLKSEQFLCLFDLFWVTVSRWRVSLDFQLWYIYRASLPLFCLSWRECLYENLNYHEQKLQITNFVKVSHFSLEERVLGVEEMVAVWWVGCNIFISCKCWVLIESNLLVMGWK